MSLENEKAKRITKNEVVLTAGAGASCESIELSVKSIVTTTPKGSIKRKPQEIEATKEENVAVVENENTVSEATTSKVAPSRRPRRS